MNATNHPIRILGLDPGLRKTGWGVVVIEGARLTHVAHGVIAPKDSLPFAERLLVLFDAIAEVIALHAPHEAAVEETFMNTNPQSALKLGHARACCLLAPARAGLSVAEYAATGAGGRPRCAAQDLVLGKDGFSHGQEGDGRKPAAITH